VNAKDARADCRERGHIVRISRRRERLPLIASTVSNCIYYSLVLFLRRRHKRGKPAGNTFARQEFCYATQIIRAGGHRVDASSAVNMYVDETRKQREAVEIDQVVCLRVRFGWRIKNAFNAVVLNDEAAAVGYSFRQDYAGISQ